MRRLEFALIFISFGVALYIFTWLERDNPAPEIRVEPNSFNFGVLKRESSHDRSLSVHNDSDRVVSLIGGTSRCSCVAVSGFPVEIPPMASGSLSVRVFAGTKSREIREQVKIYTDHPQHGIIELSVEAVAE